MDPDNHKVFIITVCRNNEKHVGGFVDSVIRSTVPVTLIVVDNASCDRTAQILEKYIPQIIVLTQKNNMGFGIGNNIGIEYALHHNADYIFLLNCDMTIEPDSVEKLLKCAVDNPEYGIISPVCLNFEKKSLEKMFYNSLFERNSDHHRDFISGLFLSRNFSPELYPLNFVNAAHWFIPAAVLKKTGGFDPVFYPAYHEDDEMCIRMRKHGFKIGFTPACQVYHDTEKRIFNPNIPEIHFVLIRYYEKILHAKSFSVFYILIATGMLRTVKHLLFFNRENFFQNIVYFFREMFRKRKILKQNWKKNRRGQSIGLCTELQAEHIPSYIGDFSR